MPFSCVKFQKTFYFGTECSGNKGFSVLFFNAIYEQFSELSHYQITSIFVFAFANLNCVC